MGDTSRVWCAYECAGTDYLFYTYIVHLKISHGNCEVEKGTSNRYICYLFSYTYTTTATLLIFRKPVNLAVRHGPVCCADWAT